MSKSNTRYIATVAFTQGITQMMVRYYLKLEGREKFKVMLKELYFVCDNAITSNPEKLNDKEAKQIERGVSTMVKYGLENAKSYKTYISFLIAVTSERLTELSKCKRRSKKEAILSDIINKLEGMYQYFDIRVKNEDLDADGLKLLNNFNLLFA